MKPARFLSTSTYLLWVWGYGPGEYLVVWGVF